MYEDSIRKGVAVLDKVLPDWRERINLDRLNVANYNLCVLGQVFGSYTEGLDVLRGPLWAGRCAFAEEHGFSEKYVDVAVLTAEWKQAIGG